MPLISISDIRAAGQAAADDPDPDGHLLAMLDALIAGDPAHAAQIARLADEDGGEVDDDTDLWDDE